MSDYAKTISRLPALSMTKCRYADKYKAIHPPRCNKGYPCTVCMVKWLAAEDKSRRAAPEKRQMSDYAKIDEDEADRVWGLIFGKYKKPPPVLIDALAAHRARGERAIKDAMAERFKRDPSADHYSLMSLWDMEGKYDE